MRILIDPPVSVYSPPEDLETWIQELQELRAAHQGDAEAQAEVELSLAEARRWLERRRRAVPPEVCVVDLDVPFASVFRLVVKVSFASLIVGLGWFVLWWLFAQLVASGGQASRAAEYSSAPAAESAAAEETPRAPPGFDSRR